MLEPQQRQLLFDALEPPAGYTFDQGIGTTYSLDLLALMMAPVAFTFFDQKRTEEGLAAASLEVLEGLRRYADRLTVFCEAGRIAVPVGRFPQLAFLEESVVQCRPPQGGSFHPKLWVLRYAGNGPARYRVLCLSRNLMFCRAWDTMLTLDGEVKTRNVAANRKLIEFLQKLPELGGDVPTSTSDRVALFAKELLTSEFVLPNGVESINFWPLGISAKKVDPFKNVGNRLLIISPFVSVTALEDLADRASECVLVSTTSQLECLSRRPKGISRFFVLNEKAVTESEETGAAVSPLMADAIAQEDLHAKLYVTESGTEARVWTGSLNASESGLNRSVEFLVELVGHRKYLGIDTLMAAEQKEVRFINLLRDVTNESLVARGATDAALEALERKLEMYRTSLVECSLQAHVDSVSSGAFDITLQCSENGLSLDNDVEARCWPVTTEGIATPFSICEPGGNLVSFSKVSLEAVTSFFAFELVGKIAEGEKCLRFVLNLPLIGAPANRRDSVLRTFLSDRGRFMKFMMLLLADEGLDPEAMRDVFDHTPQRTAEDEGNASVSGLLEMLLHALDSAPNRLDHLHSLIAQVTSDEQGRALLPADFERVWQPIWARREQLRQPQAVS
jgi:hypothetical protein